MGIHSRHIIGQQDKRDKQYVFRIKNKKLEMICQQYEHFHDVKTSVNAYPLNLMSCSASPSACCMEAMGSSRDLFVNCLEDPSMLTITFKVIPRFLLK